MKIRKVTVVVILLISLFGVMGSANANTQSDINVMVDGNFLEMDVQPTIINGRTIVPLRAIFESLGVEPKWDEKTRTVTAIDENNIISLQIDNKIVIINNMQIELDTPATIVNGRTLVPARFIAESLGAQVDWDDKTRTVIIGSNIKEADDGEDDGESGDPSSPILSLDESWDGVVNGIRTAMSYNLAKDSFSGIVENITNDTIKSVQIELNLKKGTRTVVELGPQPVGDLKPGEITTVELLVSDEPLAKGVYFNAWEIHPEAEGTGEGSNEGGNEAGGEQHNEGREGSEGTESGNEGREGSESGDEGGSYDLRINETYDEVENGARLILEYDKNSNAFIGTVKNTTTKTLTRIRVEVHLSNGAELGPTTPTDLKPGKKMYINLPATTKAFDKWTTHAEVGSAEGGEGSEGGRESGNERSEGGRESGNERSEGGREGRNERSEGGREGNNEGSEGSGD